MARETITPNLKLEEYKPIIDRFIPYKDKIDFVTLHGCGEPLLEPELLLKMLAYGQSIGLRSLNINTNGMPLTPDITPAA